jgi:hypothetical protein
MLMGRPWGQVRELRPPAARVEDVARLTGSNSQLCRGHGLAGEDYDSGIHPEFVPGGF